jgi:site-specific DNA-cytosine methylase
MRVLVGCEYSGRVREAFRALGHDAWSCDLLDSEDDSPFHIKGDVLQAANGGWDLGVFHPPCTHLSVSGARHFAAKQADGRQQEAVEFFLSIARLKIPRMAIENPVCIMSSVWRKPDQVVQPWQYGHGETKATCLWLKRLPNLVPTSIVPGRDARIHKMPPGPNRWKERSRTFEGVARAMAQQWGSPAKQIDMEFP